MTDPPLTLRGHGVVLRDWTDADLPVMSELLDEPSVERWTPLETPFTVAAASRYLARARDARAAGRAVQLAITVDRGAPLGEVLLFGLDVGEPELGYAVGLAHRGEGLAAKGVLVMSEYAFAERGLERLVLRIPPGNVASGRVAETAGFALTDEPLVVRLAKGRSVELATWERRRPMHAVEREIAGQPEAWRRAAALAPEVAGRLPAPGERLAIVGCGTSYYVGQAAAVLRERAGHGEADAFPASEVPAGRRYDAVLALSRSGTTTEVVRALERLPEGVSTSAICAVAGTPVATTAQRSVILGFADEESVVQTRFATTALALLRALAGGPVDALADEAEEAMSGPLPDGLARFDHFVFLASGWAVGLASEAALKLRESAGAWSEAYPAMEHRHGPVSVTRPTTLVWALGEVDASVLASAARAGATVVDSGRDAMVELTLVQRAAVELALERGLDPDRPRHLTRSVVLDDAAPER